MTAMNILVIDAGNTRIKWGFAENGGWLRQGWVDTARPGELAGALAGLPAAERVVACNVAGAAVQAGIEAVLPASARPRWITALAAQCGVNSGYADPAALGPDRWAALIGARHHAGGACVVVNAGTTMTVDAIDGDGTFLGGCIVPGLRLMREALARDTANLALRDGAFAYFPDNTGDAIHSGAVNALAGAVERVQRYLAESVRGDPPVLLSGGDAAVIEGRLNARVSVVDNLVLEGLLRIARESA